MRGRSLIGRACLSQRSGRAAVRALYVAVLVWWGLVCWAAPGGAEPPSTIGIELNRLEDQGGNCRAYLVFANPGATAYANFKLDLVIFDRGGVISRRLAVEAGPLRPEKTTVKLFDIPETPCSGIGSILVNDVVACRTATGDVPDCIERVATSSKLDVKLMK